MILVIDIGNTNTTIGVIDKRENFVATFNVASNLKCFEDEYGILLLKLLENKNLKNEITKIIISSVVAPLTDTYKMAVEKYLNLEPFILNHRAKLPFDIKIDNPREIGADRLANAASGKKLYKLPLIVVDIGTATSFDILDADGNFIGGIIAPGLKIQAKALSQFTSKLPKLKIEAPKTAIGKNTIDAMLSGIVRGHSALIDGMIKSCEKELGQKATIVATGGYCNTLFDTMERKFDHINPDLTLLGLKYIYDLNSGEKSE